MGRGRRDLLPRQAGGLAAQQADASAETIAALAGADVTPQPFRPVLRGVLLTGRGRQWIRREVGASDEEGRAERRALWWPPTKIAGRYLAPYLASLDEGESSGDEDRPAGQLVEFPLDAAEPSPEPAVALAHATCSKGSPERRAQRR